MREGKKKNKIHKEKKIPRYKTLIVLIISLFIISIPFVSQLKLIELDNNIVDLFPNNAGVFIDFFIYYKKIFIILFSLFLIMFFIGEKIFPDEKIECPLSNKENSSIIKLILVYSLMVIISTVFSEYKSISLVGSPTDGESAFVLLGYMVLFLSGINYFSKEKFVKTIRNGLLILMGIIVSLALVEFLYKPIFEIQIFRDLLTTEKYSDIVNSMENRYFKDMVSLTMYNPNYLGGICILLFPISATLMFSKENRKLKIISALISIGVIFVVFASKSTGPIYGLIIEIILILIYYKKTIRKNLKVLSIYLITLISVFFVINTISENKLMNIVISGIKNSPSIVNIKEKFILKDINMKDKELEIIGDNETLRIEFELNEDGEPELEFYNSKKQELKTQTIEDKITFVDDEFKAIKVENLHYGLTIDIGYNETMPFHITPEGFKGVGQSGSVIEKIKIDDPILTKLYPLATGRGYTWVNTLPILIDNPLIGTGPGTFSRYFQQYDYVGLMNTHGSAKFVIDKPHNMYLQIASQTGILSLMALLILFAIIILKSIKFYIKDKRKNDTGLSILIGCIGFLIVGLVNDSIVTVNPVFWVLLGVNVSIINSSNYKIEVGE